MVTVIFKDLMMETLNKVFKFVKTNSILVKFTCFLLVATFSFVITVVACGITVGFNINYSGKNIAVVSQTEVFDKAKDIVLKDIEDEKAAKTIKEPEFALTITVADSFDTEKKVAEAIIDNTEEINFASALKVNGEVVTIADSKQLDSIISTALNRYNVAGAENESSFVDDVKIEKVCCFTNNIKSAAQVEAVVNSLQVKTVSTVVSEVEVPFATQYIKDSKKSTTYSKVQTQGVNGVNREKAVIEFVNGNQTAKQVISSDIIKAAVTKVIVVGTKSPMANATQKAQVSSAGFICPMNKGTFVVTSYWGDGRGHKGLDLGAKTGVAIFAAKAGKVTFAGYDGNYGYSVVIDHGNGFQTRYAHASALCVRKGDTVAQGQQVAKVGNTGRSTGPHLHFEIIKNGTKVNPRTYIGL